jgi:DNA repair exonuclease SbcCD ATPase subunit
LQFSQICSSNLLILDEPGTALDSDRLLEFSKILDIAKSIGKTILMVTHIEQLKECADESYTIDKSSGYSKIIG